MADWHQGMRRADLIAHGDELNAEIDRLARENAALRAEVAELREALRATAARLEENGMTGTRTARALLARVDLPERAAEAVPKQERIRAWMHRVFANDTVKSIEERCLRVVEEVVELAQACGVDERVVRRVVNYVYQRPAGEPSQEIAGAMVTLYAAAVGLGIDADRAFETEYARICQPEIVAKIQRRQAEKRAAMVAVPATPEADRRTEDADG